MSRTPDDGTDPRCRAPSLQGDRKHGARMASQASGVAAGERRKKGRTNYSITIRMTYKQFFLWGIGIWIVGMFTGWNFYRDLHQAPQRTSRISSTALDQNAADLVRLTCLDLDYQIAHPASSTCGANQFCFSATPTTATITFYGNGGKFGQVNCAEYSQ